jgi:pimeloyl-ACP methyl ester carboxylesterase
MPDVVERDVNTFAHDGMEFQYLERGDPDGEPIVLLHGFPQDAQTWLPTMNLLASAGYRVLALNQRGYSPAATPRPFWRYRLRKLMSDAAALINTAVGTSVHLVGHDLGAEVAWNMAAASPHLVRSLTAISTPHPRALSHAFFTSNQAFRSWYISFFQLPLIPERVFRVKHGAIAVNLLQRTGLPLLYAEQYAHRLLQTCETLDGAINWYRAFLLTPSLSLGTPSVSIPTMYIWSSGDAVVSRVAANYTKRYVTGPYDFRVLENVSHWIPEEAPRALADLIASHVRLRTPELPKP